MCNTSSGVPQVRVYLVTSRTVIGGTLVEQGSTDAHKGQLQCVAFLSPYPAFVVSDGTGTLSLWSVKPYLWPWMRLMTWGNKRCALHLVAFLRSGPQCRAHCHMWRTGLPFMRVFSLFSFFAAVARDSSLDVVD